MKTVSLYRPMNMMDEVLGSFFDSPLVPFTRNRALNRLPLVDVQETGDAYTLEAELPGFDEKRIKVQVEGGKLTIEGGIDSNEEKTEEKKGSYLIQERRKLSFSRSFTLPENADTEQVSAVFRNGVLSLEIKKRPESSRRLVKIETE